MNKYPEHDKLKAVEKESQFLGGFLEWANEEGMFLAEYDDDIMRTVRKSTNTLLAEYLDIDLVKLEKEKQGMLAEIRKMNAKSERNEDL